MNNDKTLLVPDLRFPEFVNDVKWKEKLLGEIGEFIGGGTPDTNNKDFWNGEIPWFTPTEIKNGVVGNSLRTITNTGLINSSAKLLPVGTILLTTRATIGDVAITQFESATNQGFQSLLVNEDESNFFWYYWLIQHKEELLKKSSGSTFPEIGKGEIKKIKCFSPCKEEQQKIASCLSSLDELITAQKEKLELLKNHKKGLMQNLFPQEGETVPKFRFLEFENDGDWKEKILNEVADYKNGKAHEQGIVKEGKFIVVNSKFISTEGGKSKQTNHANCPAKQGDILMVLSDLPNGKALGKCFYITTDDKYTVNQRICKITSFDCDSKLLFYIMNRNAYFLSFDDGVKQTNLKNEDVKTFPFLLPKNKIEQEKIASCLSSLDELILSQTEKIEQLQSHKKGLMQGLFPKIID